MAKKQRSPSRDAQTMAKLRGLERLHTAGLIDERTYQSMLARFEAELGASPRIPPAAPSPLSSGAAPVHTSAGSAPAPSAATTPPRRRSLLVALTAIALILAASASTVLALRSHSSNPSPSTRATPKPTPKPISPALARLNLLRAAQPPAGDPLIDSISADTLARAFWPLREQALSDHDLPTLRTLETGVAAEADVALCTPGCLPASPRPFTEVRVFAPRQETYPAAFLAEVLTSTPAGDGPELDKLVFTRTSARTSWSLALDSTSGDEHLTDAPQTDPSGFDQPTPALTGARAPVQLPAELAGYWRHWAATGTAPPGVAFAAGPLSDARGRQLWARIQSDARIGVRDSFTFTADPGRDGVWTFSTSTLDPNGLPSMGWALTCGSVRAHATSIASDRTHPVIQPEDRSDFGDRVAPGNYSNISSTSLEQVCMLENPGLPAVAVAADGVTTLTVAATPLR